MGGGDGRVEPLSRACAVTPAAVWPAADHVRAVDDEHTHAVTPGEPNGEPRNPLGFDGMASPYG